MAESPEMRIGDPERTSALDRLGEHFADGYLDVAEFDARTARAASATTRGELAALFSDLPHPSSGSDLKQRDDSPAVNAAREAELERKLKVKRNCDIAAGAIVSCGAAVFFLLQFAFHVSLAWVAWPVAAIAALAVYTIAGISDEEYDVLEEIEKKDKSERAERLRIAYERRKELGK